MSQFYIENDRDYAIHKCLRDDLTSALKQYGAVTAGRSVSEPSPVIGMLASCGEAVEALDELLGEYERRKGL